MDADLKKSLSEIKTKKTKYPPETIDLAIQLSELLKSSHGEDGTHVITLRKKGNEDLKIFVLVNFHRCDDPNCTGVMAATEGPGKNDAVH